MATVRHTLYPIPLMRLNFFAFLFTLDTREEYALGWSLAGLVGCSMAGRIWVVHTWRLVISLAGESGRELAPPRYILIMLA